MVKKTTRQILKYIIIINFIFINIYVITPFLNGFGCDFKSEAKYENIAYLTSCRMGNIQSIAWNKKTGEKKLYRGILAKKNDDLLFFVIHSEELSKPINNFNDGLNARLSDASIFSAKQIHTKEYDLVLVRNPSFFIYKTNIAGKLGFW
ncbi:MAG: hypothetical protein ACRC9O_13000 [Plesiomonas sp.]|uniref:hypothetical protein n=1 Tax=Plesiomonas sp. TaxID=2486279 RepID=UPI003F334B43